MMTHGTETLLPQHLALIDASGIAPEIAMARGYRSVTTAKELAELGFSHVQQRVPALLIPIHNVMGDVALHQSRPDHPRCNAKGKPIKYETQFGHRMVLDVSPSVRSQVMNPTEPLFITEGARKTDSAVSRGLCCVALLGVWNWRGSNASGGKTVLADWEQIALNGRLVYLVFDSDVMTKREVQQALRRLKAFLESRGATVTVLYLPAAADGAKQGLDDYFFAGGTREDLLTRTVLPPQLVRVEGDDPRPVLDCDVVDLAVGTQQAWTVVAQCNVPPTLFRHGDLLVRAEKDEARRYRLVELTEARLRHEVARLTHCTRTTRALSVDARGREDCKPSFDLIRNMLAAPASDIPLPKLDAIIEVPTLSRPGHLVRTPGYDAMSRLLYTPFDPEADLAIPDHPTDDDLAWARGLIDELLVDFPFTTNADRTNAVGCMVLPFVRPSINGPTPLHDVEAPVPGTGKTLLAQALVYPAAGENVGSVGETRDEDETRKRLTARLREGRPITLFDNITRPVDSGVLANLLTCVTWEDRLLGKTETLALPVTTMWMMTANNPTLSLEIARRTVRIRLDPRRDKPWERDGFRHPDLLGWVHQERAAFVRAVLILVQRWLRAGQPATTTKLVGSFEAWTRVIGGILQHAGYTDFMANRQTLWEEADDEGAVWRTFVARWWEAYRKQPVGTAELFLIASELDGFPLGKASTERGQKTALGMQIRKRRDQVIGDFVIKAAASSNNAGQWQLQPTMASSPVSSSRDTLDESEEAIHVVDGD
ncbi:MAG: DUF3854 domain-containing protein [Nitrospira sp.]|nr:DUF3854 domain-containing protein [Nitrospira sp.]